MDGEFQQVSRRLAGLILKRPGIALGLWGEAGIGKTHTVLALLHGASCPSSSFHATQSVAGIVSAIPRPRKLTPWLERSLERLDRGEAFERGALVQTLTALLTANAPLIVHVEDLHETKPEQLEFWNELAVAVTRTRGVGLIGTSRVQPPLGFEAFKLVPLNLEASAALLEAEAGAPLPREALAWVFKQAAGNPLFTLEFFRLLARRGHLWNDNQRWRWRVPEREIMPVTVEAMIERAIDEACADPATRTGLRARAYLGSLVPNLKSEAKVWAHIAGFTPGVLESAEQTLRARGVLNESGFAHPLFREVTVAGMNAQDRKLFAGRALEILPPEVGAVFVVDAQLGADRSLEVLRRVASESKTPGRWLAMAVGFSSGAERARLALEAAQVLRLSNLPEANRLADLAMLEPTLAERATVLGAELLALQGRLSEAEGRLEGLGLEVGSSKSIVRRLSLRAMARNFTGALELWRRHPELHATRDVNVLRIAIQTLLNTDHHEEARTILGRAQALPDLSPADWTALEGFEASLCAHDGQIERAATLYARCADKHLTNGDLRLAAVALKNHGVMMERLGRFRESSQLYEQSAHRYAELGDLLRVADAKACVAWNLWHLGEYEEAETLFLESRDIQRRFESTDYLIECEGCLSLMYLDWSPPLAADLASKHARDALEIARQLGSPSDIVASLYDNVLVRLRQGRTAEARALAQEMTWLCETHGLSGSAAITTYCHALVLEALGDPDEALLLMAQAEAEHRGGEMFKIKIGIEIARLSRDIERAQKHLEWFEARGVVNGINILHRYFPALTIKGVAQTASQGAPKPASSLEVLGPMQLRLESTITPLRGGRRKEFLAMLLEARVAGRHQVSRLDLLDALYPDLGENQASAALTNLTYQLRELCGPNAVLTTDGGYALGEIGSDAEDFLESGNTRLWRGSYLEGTELDGSETVRETLHRALLGRAEIVLETDPPEAARIGRLLCEADPYDLESLRLTLKALRARANHKSLKSIYARARTNLLEIGEVLPEDWADFLRTPIGKTA